MKDNKKYISMPLILFLVVIFFFTSAPKAEAATIKMSSTAFTLTAGSTRTLSVLGTTKKVTWSSNNRSIATVTSKGKVTAKAPGTTTIYATVNGKKLSSKVTVVKISKSSATLVSGSTKTLSVAGTKNKITWSSGNKSVATVSSSGKITAKSAGTATIYASVNGVKLSSKITVVKISKSSATLSVGDSKTLSVSGTKNKITWSSSNKSIATVSSSGKITAKAAGTATIYASVNGVKLSSKITVVKISKTSVSLTVGDTKTLSVTGTKDTITWSSSDKSIATVSSSGKITAKAAGTATIYASVNGVKLSSKITVKKPVAPTPTVTPAPTSPPTTSSSLPQESQTKKVVGYYAAWSKYSGFTPDKIDATKLTHINYAFANIGSDLKITLGYPDIDAANIKQLNQLKIVNPALKTLISVGGWSWSARFSDAALTEEFRNTFAKSAVDFIVKYGFDGIDIDWEYPVSGGLATNTRRPEDKQNFTLLLKTLREMLNKQEAIDGKDYVLTFAGAAGSWYLKNIELMEINKYIDYANIMTYDIHGSWEPLTNFNSPLYSIDPLQPYKISLDTTITEWLNTGFPKEKLNMGVPFYGYIYKSVANINQGLYQTYSGIATISYANIAGNYINTPGYVRYFHETSKVPYLFNGSTFITYEDEQSMAEKASYVTSKGLGGIMIWELSQDPNRVLLGQLYKTLNQK